MTASSQRLLLSNNSKQKENAASFVRMIKPGLIDFSEFDAVFLESLSFNARPKTRNGAGHFAVCCNVVKNSQLISNAQMTIDNVLAILPPINATNSKSDSHFYQPFGSAQPLPIRKDCSYFSVQLYDVSGSEAISPPPLLQFSIDSDKVDCSIVLTFSSAAAQPPPPLQSKSNAFDSVSTRQWPLAPWPPTHRTAFHTPK